MGVLPLAAMIDVFLKTIPFFAIIALGYGAARVRFFTDEATVWLTRFVFYFALSAMIFRFAATLPISEVFDLRVITGYLWGTTFIYGVATGVALLRGVGIEEAAIEAQCAVIGNVGFLGLPMLSLLMGEQAIGPIMLMLAVDLIVFSSLVVILITGTRDGRMRLGVLVTIVRGLFSNPMIVSIVLGLMWSIAGIPIPTPMGDFLDLLGGAATPCALFAIGASLAAQSTERLAVAGWLSFCKLVLHPIFVGIGALFLFPVEPFLAAVMIAYCALPVAGNVYMLARHFGVAPHRVSASILVSTVASVLTVSLVIGWVTQFY